MSYTKNNHIICDTCRKFCIPYDEETPFGCADPENPEPYDPYHYCKKCAKELKKYWEQYFKECGTKAIGYWQKSNAEMKAAKKFKLAWVHGGVGMLGTKDFVSGYCYIPQEEYDRLKKLPYYGYCKKCGSENKNGYCSNKECSNSFDNVNHEHSEAMRVSKNKRLKFY